MSAKILVVDDSTSIRQLVRDALESEGYEIVEGEDGEQGLAALQATSPSPDLVITDIYMSRMDGLSLVRSIRALPSFRFTPILILSTEAGDELKQRGRALGATGWIVKPFDADQLQEVVSRVLRSKGSVA
jgi:two-component system chemotaxis response regulator CheY